MQLKINKVFNHLLLDLKIPQEKLLKRSKENFIKNKKNNYSIIKKLKIKTIKIKFSKKMCLIKKKI